MIMTHSAVGESRYSLQEYFEKNNLTEECKAKVQTSDIIIMPYRYEGEFYFADESVTFYKYCKSRGEDIEILADDDIKVRSLNSFDIWMPLIFVANEILLPMAIAIVSDYIIQKRRGREEEPCNIDVTYKVKHGDDFKELHYKGNADTFVEHFEKIDLNSF